jgi:putative membrane protein
MAPETREKTNIEPGASWTALENTRLAYERTLMAWIRTSISLISFGFTIYKFFQYVQESQPEQIRHMRSPRVIGMFMISTGIFTLLLATLEHWHSRKMLREQYAGMQVSLAAIVAALISTLGLMALIATIFRQ